MRFLRRLADTNFFSRRFRRNRSAFFVEFLKTIPKEQINILDVGGTVFYWRDIGLLGDQQLKITILNLELDKSNYPNVTSMLGDARNMYQFSRKEFDVVFSNSVIEHLESFDDQKKMASEVQRVGKRYYMQTPNYYFPIEPHFFLPGFQFLPLSIRVMLLRNFNLGWYKKMSDPDLARKEIESVRLLTRRELAELFPGGRIIEEKLIGLTKSLVIFN